MKTLIILLIIGLVFLSFITVSHYINPKEIDSEKRLYQGPVPEGYDEECFRQTGQTKLIGECD